MTIVLKACLVGLAVYVSAMLPAHAISRYESLNLTCDEARSIVNNEGAAILRYQSERNPSLTLYDRYVRNSAFCQSTQYAKKAWVPTADTRSCPVLSCEEADFEDDFFFRE